MGTCDVTFFKGNVNVVVEGELDDDGEGGDELDGGDGELCAIWSLSRRI
jgi:hypothetical protein